MNSHKIIPPLNKINRFISKGFTVKSVKINMPLTLSAPTVVSISGKVLSPPHLKTSLKNPNLSSVIIWKYPTHLTNNSPPTPTDSPIFKTTNLLLDDIN